MFNLTELLDPISQNEFKQDIKRSLEKYIINSSWTDKLSLVEKELYKIDSDLNVEPKNKRKPWSDDELRLVLSMAPNRSSVMILAKALGRGHGSIEQIYRWAGQSKETIITERSNNAFVQQIVRIRKEIGWLSIGSNK